MKITESMLREYVDTPLSVVEIGDLLTMTGFELEEIEVVEGENILNVNIMANRGDGASVIGLARELLAKSADSKKTELFERAEVRFHSADEMDQACAGLATVEIRSDNCSRYACRVFDKVKNGTSPSWLVDRLRRIGQRPISLLVDLTNYVMFETGQPLHAFDLDKLSGNKIIVRQALISETTFTTLDEIDRKITPDDLMICDAEKPVAIAGVMGGLSSEVSSATKRMLLESAHFDHKTVRNTRTRLGLSTEASYRFERYVDPEQVVAALNRFAELYEQITEDWGVRGIIDVYPRPPQPQQIAIEMRRCDVLLGINVLQIDAASYLKSLGFEVKEAPGVLYCTPPSWRNDVLRQEDVIEEIGRVHGYDKISEILPRGETTRGGVFGLDEKVDRVREVILRCGFTQIISHSLRNIHSLDAPGERVRVRKPHSPDIAYLRNSNLPCLAEAAHKNGLDNLNLFEIGKVFAVDREFFGLSLLSVGRDAYQDWQKEQSASSDFYSIKGVVDQICSIVGVAPTYETSHGLDERLHPSRQANIVLNGNAVGVFGQIHPIIAETSGLRPLSILADIDLEALVCRDNIEKHVNTVSKNPSVRRDVAVMLEKSVPYAVVSKSIVDACGSVLEKHWLFDVFEGKGIPSGSHSLAIALQFRKHGENFTDEEANQVRDLAVVALESLGATLR